MRFSSETLRAICKKNFMQNWKSFLTLLFTLAGIVVPIFLWRADLSSKRLKITLKSAAELRPKGLGSLDGIQVSIDGMTANNPYVSVIELSNIGSKPILAADFEGSLKVVSSKSAKIVKVQVESTNPAYLKPIADVRDGEICVQPLLLNPNDFFTLTVVTENARPTFDAQVRIAGVTDVVLDESEIVQGKKGQILAYAVVILTMSIYSAKGGEVFYFARRKQKFYSSAVIFIGTGSAGI